MMSYGNMKSFILIFSLSCFCFCKKHASPVQKSDYISFSTPVKVTVRNYNQDIMEPFLSRDGKYLFFNNLNDPSVTNTNIYYAERINDTSFEYKGEVQGVNSDALDAVATMDERNNFYFVSTRSYKQTLSTIYNGIFANGSVSLVDIVPGISLNKAGMVNFDVEVSADGNSLYFVDGKFTNSGLPLTADIALALKKGNGFVRANNSKNIFENVDSDQLEYAACISRNELILFFTRVREVNSNAMPRIFYSTRKNKNESFNEPVEIKEIDGFVEAATLSADEHILYYHKRENDKFVLYCVSMGN